MHVLYVYIQFRHCFHEESQGSRQQRRIYVCARCGLGLRPTALPPHLPLVGCQDGRDPPRRLSYGRRRGGHAGTALVSFANTSTANAYACVSASTKKIADGVGRRTRGVTWRDHAEKIVPGTHVSTLQCRDQSIMGALAVAVCDAKCGACEMNQSNNCVCRCSKQCAVRQTKHARSGVAKCWLGVAIRCGCACRVVPGPARHFFLSAACAFLRR